MNSYLTQGLTDKQRSDIAYNQEIKAHGKECIERCIGSAADYYKYVWKEGAAAQFSNWLDTPEPDWQKDC